MLPSPLMNFWSSSAAFHLRGALCEQVLERGPREDLHCGRKRRMCWTPSPCRLVGRRHEHLTEGPGSTNQKPRPAEGDKSHGCEVRGNPAVRSDEPPLVPSARPRRHHHQGSAGCTCSGGAPVLHDLVPCQARRELLPVLWRQITRMAFLEPLQPSVLDLFSCRRHRAPSTVASPRPQEAPSTLPPPRFKRRGAPRCACGLGAARPVAPLPSSSSRQRLPGENNRSP